MPRPPKFLLDKVGKFLKNGMIHDQSCNNFVDFEMTAKQTAVKMQTSYPVKEVVEVKLRQNEVDIEFIDNSGRQSLSLKGSETPTRSYNFLYECYEIRIIDRNSEESNSLEFGRWRVEIWDEDNPTCGFNCDDFDVFKLD